MKFQHYQTDDENVSVNAMIKDETMWLTQKSMAELLDVEVPAINKHLKNIFEEGELQESSTISKMEIVRSIRASERRIWQQIPLCDYR